VLVLAGLFAALAAIIAGQPAAVPPAAPSAAAPVAPASTASAPAADWQPVSVAWLPELPATRGPGATVPVVSLPAPAGAAPPHLTCTAAVLIDAATGAVLYDRDADRRWAPASITKVLTAIVALEWGDLRRPVTVSGRAAWMPGSDMKIDQGEVWELGDLMYGLMLESGNDAAVAIAEHIAGSVGSFSSLMNVKAWEIGAGSSRFCNPHGLSDPGHFSTAYDLALIGRWALKDPTLAHIVATREFVARERTTGRALTLQNTNRLLWEYDWVRGIKTGTTPAAGKCLMFAASRGDLHLIGVVLDSDDRWRDSLALLQWGFEAFEARRFARAGFPAGRVDVTSGRSRAVPVVVASDLTYPVARGAQDIAVRRDPYAPLLAPVRPGQPVGQLVLCVAGRDVVRVDLIALVGVPRLGVWGRLWRALTGG